MVAILLSMFVFVSMDIRSTEIPVRIREYLNGRYASFHVWVC